MSVLGTKLSKKKNIKPLNFSVLAFNYIIVLCRIIIKGESTLNWKLRTSDCKITLEDKRRIGYLTYYISSGSIRNAESE